VPRGAAERGHAIEVHLARLLAECGMTLTELADRVGVTIVNLSILKNGRAKAIRFTTLTRLCHVLGCQPGDLLSYATTDQEGPTGAAGARAARKRRAPGRGGCDDITRMQQSGRPIPFCLTQKHTSPVTAPPPLSLYHRQTAHW